VLAEQLGEFAEPIGVGVDLGLDIAQVISGVRVLAQISASTSELSSPRRRILSGGISKPS